ncbi:MAG: hypothetical protein KF681_11715 [Bdellovibrionaceae bacterium]|nr:hypothetical protein [Pseudobdellovibrionaceae bacterium]
MKQTSLAPDELARLVDELMKDEPDQKLIRSLMGKQGLPYSKDPITQMSTVLQSMDQNAAAPAKMKESNLT